MTEPETTSLAEKIQRVGPSPGVYLMKDRQGRIIYVGKARNLKKRLTSYAKPIDQLDVKTGVLVRRIADVETIATASENEALILEQTLIKRHRPRYNVVLKDDKRYPSLRLEMVHAYPRLSIVRTPRKDGNRHFGPFASAHAVRQTLKFIDSTFKLRKCRNAEFDRRTRPCLHHQMGACLGPCCLPVAQDAYAGIVRQVVLFLSGRTPQLLTEMRADMQKAAADQCYEQAAVLRDRIAAMEKTLERQVVVTQDFTDRDALGVAASETVTVVTLLQVRNGYLIGSRHAAVKETLATDPELVGAFIRQHYTDSARIPQEILLPVTTAETLLIEAELRETAGHAVRIYQPKRGEKVRLLALALQNAADRLKEVQMSADTDTDLLFRLQKRLHLSEFPHRIECIDNSNLMGTAPVAGLVVFENGRPAKAMYRRYRIRSVTGADDYATMAEVLTRRFIGGGAGDDTPFPDLLLLDGGKGQLNVAMAVIASMDLVGRFGVAGIAKKDERWGDTQDKIYLPGRSNPVNFGRDGDVLLFLQKIRDETHRYAVGYHRQRRRADTLRSVLDPIPGIGATRRRILLTHFREIAAIRKATVAEMAALPGMSLKAAEAVRSFFNDPPTEECDANSTH
ncbi:MAG: excinuclease ABC subunit UvrC [Pseudomonadota bacterium]